MRGIGSCAKIEAKTKNAAYCVFINKNTTERTGKMKYQVKDYHVKELADYYGISAQAVRLYDKKGLLPSDKNEVNGYRTYTREDIITMDYIYRLKKMHFSLEEIRRIMNEEPLEQVAEMVAVQQRKLEEEVWELQYQLGYLADYYEKLDQVLTYEKSREKKQAAKMEIVEALPFIIREITTNMDEAMDSFRRLDSNLIPFLTVETPVEEAKACMEKEKIGAFLTNRENRMNGDYKLSLIDEKNLSTAPDFDFETFRVIPPCTALYTVVRIATNKDYNQIEEIFAFLRKGQYEICGNVLARTIANCYCDKESTEYVEIWIPIRKQERNK